MKFQKKYLRKIFFGIAILLSLGLVWGLTDTWRYSRFPGTSSFAKYLPESATATFYNYTSAGLQDYFIEFEASGTREDFDQFVKNLLESLPNARVREQPYSWVDGVAQFSEDMIKISADHEIGVTLYWNDGSFRMFFSKT